MRFVVAEESMLFASSVRGAVGAWEAPREPSLGAWWDERDDALAARLGALGWSELWSAPELLGAAVAGGVELGRAVAPICLVDEATLGAPLAVGGRARHGEGATIAVGVVEGSLVEIRLDGVEREASLDGTGTIRLGSAARAGLPLADGAERLRAWSATTLAYLAGLAAEAVDDAVHHVKAREQFGAPLAALPAVQARLADAALAADGILLVAWGSAASDERDAGLHTGELLWAAGACRAVTASMLQAYGAVGFALESGAHRAFRRAASAQAWVEAVVRETCAFD
jgi:hypothetical protein